MLLIVTDRETRFNSANRLHEFVKSTCREAFQASIKAMNNTGSDTLTCYENAWNMLRTVVPCIPEAVVTLIDARSRGKINGYLTHSAWAIGSDGKHEVGINPCLNGAPSELVATMLHEAVHALLFERGGNGGVSPNGHYHRKEFRDLAVELGLECKWLNGRHGFTLTQWPDSGVPVHYEPIADFLGSHLTVMKAVPGVRRVAQDMPKKGHVSLHCQCVPARVIYTSRANVEMAGLQCNLCNGSFRP